MVTDHLPPALRDDEVVAELSGILGVLSSARLGDAVWPLACADALQLVVHGDSSAVVMQRGDEIHVDGTAESRTRTAFDSAALSRQTLARSGVWTWCSHAGVSVPLRASGAMAIVIWFDHLLSRAAARRTRVLLEIVHPVLASAALGRFAGEGSTRAPLPASLQRLLESLTDGVLVYDVAGAPIWHNAALSRVRAAEPEWPHILTAARQLACGRDGERKEARTAAARYQLLATRIDHIDAVIVTMRVQQSAPSAESDTAMTLRTRYGLTRRELEVTRLLLRGQSNRDIATQLNISAHTARHHTERVLGKLGVRSRAAIAVAVGSR